MTTVQHSNDSECLISDQMLAIFYGTGLILVIIYVSAGIIMGTISRGTFVFIIAYGVVSGLVVFKKISITECPSKVLVIGILYTIFSYFINT